MVKVKKKTYQQIMKLVNVTLRQSAVKRFFFPVLTLRAHLFTNITAGAAKAAIAPKDDDKLQMDNKRQE